MSSYYYRGKKYTRKPGLKVKLKRLATRAFDAMHGNHPGGAEALVERMIREYPERPKPAAKAPVETPAKPPAEVPVETPVQTPTEAPVEADTKKDVVE